MLEVLSNYFTYSNNNLMDNTLLDICAILNELNYIDKYEIPIIVSIGVQSSGKSQTLNNIINYPILPVNKIMTTKTPCRIELRNNDRETLSIGYVENNSYKEVYQNILKNINCDIVADNITNITNIFLEGTGLEVSNREIIIKIDSKNVPNLTCIDLPGIIALNKSEVDTKTHIRDLVKSYIVKSNVIILGIFPARMDLETDFVFELIKEYDENFDRTIGCLTKIDLLTDGDMSNYLTNNIEPNLRLKYGYYAVKNIGDEEGYFKTHKVYSKMGGNKLGIYNLTKKLNKILIDKVSILLPSIIENINGRLVDIDEKLMIYGENIMMDDKECMLNTIIHRFTQSFINTLDNNIIDVNYSIKIKDIFIKYREEVNNIKSFEDLSDNDIDKLLKNNEKNKMFIEMNYIEILENIFKGNNKSLNLLRNLSINCSKEVYVILFELIDELIRYNNLSNYNNLLMHIKDRIRDKLDGQMLKIDEEVNNLVLYEKSYLWTEDKSFIDKYLDVKNDSSKNIIKDLYLTYFNTIKETFQNIIPKLIMYYLIRILENNMSSLLLSNNSIELLEENETIANERLMLKNEKKKLEQIKLNISKII
jgi:hypothetical protein